jgi:Phage integrase family
MRLATALREHRHLRSARVLCRHSAPLSADVVNHYVERAARRARLSASGVHRLRHTFCSHQAMRGAPARAIQELAGHKDLITTQRYMHLSPAALEGAIRLLDATGIRRNRGDILETASSFSSTLPVDSVPSQRWRLRCTAFGRRGGIVDPGLSVP